MPFRVMYRLECLRCMHVQYVGYLKMHDCLLGLEFAGINTSGQRVMGLLSAKGQFI
jgi:hypothetical protein